MVDLSLVIPCYNESASIPSLAERLTPIVDHLRLERSTELLFVDDGSVDGTAEMLQRAFSGDPNMRLERHPVNRGLGAALRTGFRASRGEVVVTTDSDGSYPYALIPPLLDHLRPGVHIVTASCYHPRGGVAGVPYHRLLFSRSASLIYSLLLRRGIHTYTCMFRAYRREAIGSIPFQSDGFLAVTEIMVNALKLGYAVEEYPCTLEVRRYGVSKARIWRIIRAHLSLQRRLLLNRGLAEPLMDDGRL